MIGDRYHTHTHTHVLIETMTTCTCTCTDNHKNGQDGVQYLHVHMQTSKCEHQM